MQNEKEYYRTYITKRLLCVTLMILFLGSSKDFKKGYREGYRKTKESSVVSPKQTPDRILNRTAFFKGIQLMLKVF